MIGRIVSRRTRFTLVVELDGREEEVYCANSGALSTVLREDREVLCMPKSEVGRRTKFDGFAVRVDDFYVTIDSRFANGVFEELIQMKSVFPGFSVLLKEKQLPDYGRIDFVVQSKDGSIGYVEVKSCTHVVDGVAKFPDRPTERGRRHLRKLEELVLRGNQCWIVFVVQRPDATEFRPFREVDHEFSELLARAVKTGVRAKVFKIEFLPPNRLYFRGEIPIVL